MSHGTKCNFSTTDGDFLTKISAFKEERFSAQRQMLLSVEDDKRSYMSSYMSLYLINLFLAYLFF